MNRIDQRAKKSFTAKLVNWHATANTRSLPWKSEKDPYRIWLSEVILQQTRALQGLPYYLKFTETYPTIKHLAAANDDDAFRLWQGLGYYNRCKNMLATARYVTNELKGRFPESYEEILALKGIGPYTAAAIASFAYDLPHAVVDGNVYRVLARCFGIDIPFDTTEGKKLFSELAGELLDANSSAAYNQAIMDLGATVCTPANPLCGDCPLQHHCVAFRQDMIDLLPVRSKKINVRKRYFHYILIKWNNQLWITKRAEKDIWQNLHEPFLIEGDRPMTEKELQTHDLFKNKNISASHITYAGSLAQRLTHQIIESRFFTITTKKKPEIIGRTGRWVSIHELNNTAFPRTLVSFLEKNLYF